MKSKSAAKIKSAVVRYVILAIGTVIFTLPMIYMISTSLRPNGALYEYPPRFFPRWEALTLENYDYILHQSKFHLNFFNSVIVSVSTIVLAAAVGGRMDGLRSYCAAARISCNCICQHFQFSDGMGRISMGEYRHKRQQQTHAADRHRRLFRTASIHPVGLCVCNVCTDAHSRRADLYRLSEVFCSRLNGRQRKGIKRYSVCI